MRSPLEGESSLSPLFDLARAERARLEALRAPGVEDEDEERAHVDVTGFEPLLGDNPRVVVAPCLRIVERDRGGGIRKVWSCRVGRACPNLSPCEDLAFLV